jgi:hypothetical protein
MTTDLGKLLHHDVRRESPGSCAVPTDFGGRTSCNESARPGQLKARGSAVFLRALPLALALALHASCAQGAPRLHFPDPRSSPTSGSELAQRIGELTLVDREAMLWQEFERGNVPAHLGRLVPVTTSAIVDGTVRTARFWVAPDWFGFGTEADWLRMPMAPPLAQRIADRLDCTLPTRRMSDAIWQQSSVKVTPLPISPKQHDICAVAQFHRHHDMIEGQLQGTDRAQLVAGAKKDVVVSALMAAHPRRVVIYGWHQLDGKPIQPLSKVHGFGHVDYSHGIRFVARAMDVDGRPTTVAAVLADPDLHVLLSDEGTIGVTRYPVE